MRSDSLTGNGSDERHLGLLGIRFRLQVWSNRDRLLSGHFRSQEYSALRQFWIWSAYRTWTIQTFGISLTFSILIPCLCLLRAWLALKTIRSEDRIVHEECLVRYGLSRWSEEQKPRVNGRMICFDNVPTFDQAGPRLATVRCQLFLEQRQRPRKRESGPVWWCRTKSKAPSLCFSQVPLHVQLFS